LGEGRGRLAGGAGAAELADESAEGVVGVAGTLGDVLLATAAEEDAAEGLVLAPGGARGLEEGVAAGLVRRGAYPEQV
jgi:hypothetical protein